MDIGKTDGVGGPGRIDGPNKIARSTPSAAASKSSGADKVDLSHQAGMISKTLGFVVVGELAGAGAVIWLSPMAAELFFRVSPRDPLLLASVAAFVFTVSLWACFWPAWLAAGDDLQASLRAR